MTNAEDREGWRRRATKFGRAEESPDETLASIATGAGENEEENEERRTEEQP